MNKWQCVNCGTLFQKIGDKTFRHLDKFPNHRITRIVPKGF